jgi:hypothetical protein
MEPHRKIECWLCQKKASGSDLFPVWINAVIRLHWKPGLVRDLIFMQYMLLYLARLAGETTISALRPTPASMSKLGHQLFVTASLLSVLAHIFPVLTTSAVERQVATEARPPSKSGRLARDSIFAYLFIEERLDGFEKSAADQATHVLGQTSICSLSHNNLQNKTKTYLHTPSRPPYLQDIHNFPHPSVHVSHLNIDQIVILLPIRLGIVVLGILIPLLLRLLLFPLPLVEPIQHLRRNPIKQVLRVDPQQLPRQIQTLVDIPLLVRALAHESAFELVQELKGQLVFRRQGFLADHGFHGGGVAADGVFGVELVGDVTVVFAGAALADGGFHETGKGRENVDGWVDALVGEAAVDEDLALGDVAC